MRGDEISLYDGPYNTDLILSTLVMKTTISGKDKESLLFGISLHIVAKLSCNSILKLEGWPWNSAYPTKGQFHKHNLRSANPVMLYVKILQCYLGGINVLC